LASLPVAETPVTPTGEPLTVTVKLLGIAVFAAMVSLYVRVKIVPEAPNTALLITGGIENGVIAFDGGEADEDMSPFIAVDVNVYATPFVKPVTTQDPDAPVTVHVLVGSSTVVTRYEVGTVPEPAVTLTVACMSAATAVGAGATDGAV
jgi:hypothetical protein